MILSWNRCRQFVYFVYTISGVYNEIFTRCDIVHAFKSKKRVFTLT